MEYSNQEIPEGINYSRTHPLKEFFILTFGVLGSLLVLFFVLALLADKVAHLIPFEYEKDMNAFVDATDWPDPEMQSYMQGLADSLSAGMDLPDGMEISVHYNDSDIVNAYATLGGNVVFYKGLLEKMPGENALAMVMAHEIAHVKSRHPIRSLGKGVVLMIVVSMVSSSVGDAMVGNVVGNTGVMALLSFSRSHEEEADELAIEQLTRLYGHVRGAEDLFKAIKESSDALSGYELPFLKTHPDIDSRIERIEALSTRQEGATLTPLPDSYSGWLE